MVAVTASLVGVSDPRAVQVVVTGLTVGDEYEIRGNWSGGSWPVRAGAGTADASQVVRTDVQSPVNTPLTYTVAVGGVDAATSTDAVWVLDATNLVTNPSGEATSGTVEVRRNLALNPSLETATTWWSAWPGTTLTRVARSGYVGDYVAQLVCSGASAAEGLTVVVNSPPNSASFAASILLGGAGTVNVSVRFNYTEGGFTTSSETTVNLSDTPARYGVTGAPDPARTLSSIHLLVRTSTAQAVTFYADAILVEATTVVGSYFDGSTSPDPDLTPEWLGTPHASESRLVAPAPVGWSGAYYSASRDRIAALPAGATYTLAADPGPATLVVETETDTLHTPHTGTAVTVTEPYFRAAVVPGDYTGPYFDGDTPDTATERYAWTGAANASTATRELLTPVDPVTVDYAGRYVLQSLDGNRSAAFRLLDNRLPVEYGLRTHTFSVPGRSRPVVRYDVAGGESGELVLRTVGAESTVLRDLVTAGAPLLLRTDGTVRDLDATLFVQPTRFSGALSGAWSDTQGTDRHWQLGYERIDDPEPDTLVAASTWDDFDAVYAGSTWNDFDAEWADSTWNDFDTADWALRAEA